MEPETDCATVTHLKWTLARDWTTITGGQALAPDWETRATAWDGNQADTAAWVAAITPVQTPSWAALQRAQIAAGLNSRFRDEDAFSGDQRHGWYKDLERRVIRKLDVDGQNEVSPLARGIRGFLDIIHVHPFTQGNTRAACTWLVWSLVGADMNVPDLTELMQLPKTPGDEGVVRKMAELLA